MELDDLKEFLDQKVLLYNNKEFIQHDPIQIVHQFNQKEDIEIIGFLTATIAWGNRKSIINNAQKMAEIFKFQPFDFVLNYHPNDIGVLNNFVHRTFQTIDFHYFLLGLKHIYQHHGGLENVFNSHQKDNTQHFAIHQLKKTFQEVQLPQRTHKHLSDPLSGSASKRIHMFLRWMVRQDNAGVDFGLWQQIPMSHLSCPLDVHTGNIARKLGLLKRTQNDFRALNELDDALRHFDDKDPVKYDFALFGLGAFEGF